MPAFSSLLLIALLSLAAPGLAGAQATTENAEARVYFEEGNRLYQEASATEGSRRTTLLQRSLEAYVDSLQIVRSRNALFNAAIVLGELERYHESFNYFSEYLAIEGLTGADRAEANRRRDELRAKVAVLEVVSDPTGALVFVDRKDLAPRGQTPIELAILEGEHSLFFELEGFAPAELSCAAVRGETTRVEVVLEPVSVVPTVEPEPAPMP
ncbi:MAG: PEGA domain-containing protein, partial [Polyangiales bacterium]